MFEAESAAHADAVHRRQHSHDSPTMHEHGHRQRPIGGGGGSINQPASSMTAPGAGLRNRTPSNPNLKTMEEGI